MAGTRNDRNATAQEPPEAWSACGRTPTIPSGRIRLLARIHSRRSHPRSGLLATHRCHHAVASAGSVHGTSHVPLRNASVHDLGSASAPAQVSTPLMSNEVPLPAETGDARRLEALSDYDILDTPPEKGFDDIVALARLTCAAPVALISLVADDRQWFKARSGFAPSETSLDKSVCAHVLAAPGLLVIPDLTLDPRTRGNPLVTGEPHLRFYAGEPLTTPAGERLGSLCVIDLAPRPEGLTNQQAEALRALAGQVMSQMELRRSVTERDRVLSGQAALIAQQNALIATQAAVTNAAGNRDAILDALVAGVMGAIPQAEGSVIELREGDELVYRSGRGTLAAHVGLRLPLDGSLSGHCLTKGKPVLCPDVLLDPRVKRDVIAPLGMRSAVYVPIFRGNAAIGVLKLQASQPNAFSGRDLRVATLFAGTIPAGLAEAGEAEARRGMRAGEATLRTVMETLPVGVLIAEAPSGRIIGHNARVEALLGHEVMSSTAGSGPDRWVGYHADGRPVAPEEWPLIKVACEGSPQAELEVDYQRGDGTRMWVAFSGAPMHDADGRLVGAVVVVADIDSRKRTEQQMEAAKAAAEEANRAKSEFLANMSHELRTPLSAVIGYSEMLQEEMEDLGLESLLVDMRKIEANARHLLGLINDVLDLSKIEAERMDVYVEEFSVEAVVRDVASTVEALIERNGNTFVLDLRDGLGTARTDVTKLRQCLINLLSNAAKFTQSGQVTLVAERREHSGVDMLSFQVKDTGIGMSAEQQARLFERFSQADASTTRRFGGTGLGLSITRAFAHMLGGDISVSSEDGKGTTFTVLLPADYVEEASGGGMLLQGSGEEMLASLPGMVLVVDDDTATRELLTRFLEKNGFRVVTAMDGREGLETARALRPRAILLDVTMPRMDGWSVLRALRSDPELGDTPIIMVTVLDEQNLAFSLGATDYLQKPIDWAALEAAMARFRPPLCEGPVLIIDDEADARGRMETLITREGWRTVSAKDGYAGLIAVQAERPCLILLDLMMPEMDGFAFLRALRAKPEWSTIPVVVLTAKDITAEDRRRLAGKADRVIQKGQLSLSDLGDAVRALVPHAPSSEVAP